MKPSHATLVAAFLAITFAPACSESSDWATAPGASALATRTEHNNDRLPFLLEDIDNPCTDGLESIDFEGVIHGQGSQWDSHFKSHYNVILTGTDANGSGMWGNPPATERVRPRMASRTTRSLAS